MEQANWQDKMNSIPIKEDAASAWKEMELLLNQQLPIIEPATSSATLKTVVAKLASMLTYVLPAAAMITAGTYIFAPKIKENKSAVNPNIATPNKPKNTPLIKVPDTVSKQKDTLDKVIAEPDSLPSMLKAKPRKRLRVDTSAMPLLPFTADTATKFNTEPKQRIRRVADTVRKNDIPAQPAPRARKRNAS